MAAAAPASLKSGATPPVLRIRKHNFGSDVYLWGLFFLICFGLGYATLNRYDPGKALPDAATYFRLAQDGPSTVEGHFRFRILVPVLARPVYWLAKGRVGSWDPLSFAFLVVNSFFVASTVYLLFKVGAAHLGNRSIALLASALYVLNFDVANSQLAGLVDAGEACLLMAIIASIFLERWWMLPLLGALGALAKESFVPLSIVMAVAWWFVAQKRSELRSRAVWISAMIASELVAITVLHLALSKGAVGLWNFALGLNSHANYFANFVHSLFDRSSWYILIWLLPLGLVRIRRFPREWVWAAAAGSVTALLLNAYHSTVGGGGGGIGRYIFDVAGPLLSLAAAEFLSQLDTSTPGYTAVARNRSRM